MALQICNLQFQLCYSSLGVSEREASASFFARSLEVSALPQIVAAYPDADSSPPLILVCTFGIVSQIAAKRLAPLGCKRRGKRGKERIVVERQARCCRHAAALVGPTRRSDRTQRTARSIRRVVIAPEIQSQTRCTRRAVLSTGYAAGSWREGG